MFAATIISFNNQINSFFANTKS